MTGTSRYNDQNPTDPTMLAAVILSAVLLAKTFTQEEISSLVALASLGLSAIPHVRR